MKCKRFGIALTLLCLVILPLRAGLAEEHEEAEPMGPSFRPIEIYACSFNEGESMESLMQVTARWNAWMDAEGQDNYWAFTLVPVFHSAEIDFDVAWVGGWWDGAAMAASTKFWIDKGGEYQKAFEEVVDCTIHVNFAVLDVQRSIEPFGAGPIEFTDCTLEEDRTMAEAVSAVNQWVAYAGEQGLTAGEFLLFPAFGESSDAEYDFKWVTQYDYDTFGRAYDQFGTGGGWRKYGELFDGLLDCDNPRIYHGMAVRTVELAE